MDNMKNFKDLTEAISSKSVVVFFGRCNPPTTGHLIAFKTVVETAKKMKADYSIVISRTQDKKSNPLNLSQKLEYLKILFPGIQFTGASDTMRTPIEVLKQLNKTYKNITFIAGSDRVDEFSTLFNKYNGSEYNFDSIKVISAGERDPDSDSASGMSSTKMRKAVVDNDITSFKRGLLAHVREIDAKRLMNDIRQGLGLEVIKESFKFETSDLREKYVAGEIFAEGTYVTNESVTYKIINRNSNYLTVSDSSGVLTKQWLTDVKSIDESDAITAEFKEITEMKFSSNDKLKVAKIIGGMLGADIEKMTNPEQIVNAGLRIAKTKPMNAESTAILQRMLKTATDAGIKFDAKLIAQKTDEAETGDVDSADFKLSSTGRKVRARNLVFDTKTKSKNNAMDEAEREHEHVLKAKVEKAHSEGERHITTHPKDQVIADAHHDALNNLGGKQVLLPTGHTLGGSSDQQIKMKDKYVSEANDDTYDNISDTAEFESDEAEDDDISDADIDDWISNIEDIDDIIDVYDSSELSIIDKDTGEHVADVPTTDENPIHENEELNEVLSRMERIKVAMRFARTASTRERKIKIALRRKSSQPQINHRARSLAIRTMKLKLAKKPLDQLSVADKERIEKIMKRRKAVIDRMAVKLIPKIRGIERTRLSHPAFTKEA